MAHKQLREIMDMAIQYEADANEFYARSAEVAKNLAAKALLKEFAGIELKHKEKLESFNLDEIADEHHAVPKTHDLHVSDYLLDKGVSPDSTSQDIMIHAMKREQKAYEFYTRMLKSVTSEDVRSLFEELAEEELEHKVKIETEYDDVVYKEN
ncbi:MAG: ferritin family protein [Candidatus Scalindua sp.]|nr:ferritin family protein [Candidatus Scalindua sp.]